MILRLVGLPLLCLTLVLSGCDGLLDPGEPGVPESELRFVRVAPGAPELAEREVSFWIKRGETREVQIRYQYSGPNGTKTYAKCLLFRVPAQAPLRYPDGRAFAVGDSARVTIRVTDPTVFRFEFDPGGLEFDPAHAAELEVRYSYADPDHNGDGVVDSQDEAIARRFGFWHQRRPGERWESIATTRRADLLEARARVTGFSQYALASN